jgi:hypothetical protein
VNSVVFSRKIRYCQGLHHLVSASVGIAGLRAIVALLAEHNPAGNSMVASTVQWILCASTLILIAASEWHVRERCPGITSLFRGFCCGAITGALLPAAADLIFYRGFYPAPPFLAELLGLTVTWVSAMPLKWVFTAIDADLPVLPEGEALTRLSALIEMVQHSAHS